jgi:hypothetical protein
MKVDEPILVQYKSIVDYVPQYGDFIVRAGWINSNIGVVSNFDNKKDELYIIFSSLPLLLFTMNDAEQERNTETIKLSNIKNASKGKWAIQQHNKAHNAIVWYI